MQEKRGGCSAVIMAIVIVAIGAMIIFKGLFKMDTHRLGSGGCWYCHLYNSIKPERQKEKAGACGRRHDRGRC